MRDAPRFLTPSAACAGRNIHCIHCDSVHRLHEDRLHASPAGAATNLEMCFHLPPTRYGDLFFVFDPIIPEPFPTDTRYPRSAYRFNMPSAGEWILSAVARGFLKGRTLGTSMSADCNVRSYRLRPAHQFGSWIRIQLVARMYLHVPSVFPCTGRGPVMSRSPTHIRFVFR
jgi:hypothetical protein